MIPQRGYAFQPGGIYDTVFADSDKGGVGQLFLQGCKRLAAFVYIFSAVEEGAPVSGIHVDDFLGMQVEGGLADTPFQRKGILMDIVYETLKPRVGNMTPDFDFGLGKIEPFVQCYFHMILLF